MEMSLADVGTFVGLALSCWAVGWCLGYLHRLVERLGEVVV